MPQKSFIILFNTSKEFINDNEIRTHNLDNLMTHG